MSSRLSRREKADALVVEGRKCLARDSLKAARRAFWSAYLLRCQDLEVPICTAAKLRMDVEQMDYLIATGKLPSSLKRYVVNGRVMLKSLRAKRTPANQVSFVFPGMKKKLAPFFGRPFSLYLPRAGKEPAVNRGLKSSEIEHRGRKTGIFVVDDVLTRSALERLRRFCLESAIWNDVKSGNYIGADLDRGFCCELLFQIAAELREAYDCHLGNLPIRWMWAYRCLGPGSGLHEHADGEGMTANLWLTPDEANLAPSHGGMFIYRTTIPPSWPARKYIGDPQAIRKLLARNEDQGVYVPYRCNRMVLFDSSRFHKSDRLRFAGGYENGRINMTLIYGDHP